jgi:hypothetical protein
VDAAAAGVAGWPLVGLTASSRFHISFLRLDGLILGVGPPLNTGWPGHVTHFDTPRRGGCHGLLTFNSLVSVMLVTLYPSETGYFRRPDVGLIPPTQASSSVLPEKQGLPGREPTEYIGR